jgi:5,10-methylenetetrahydromethanopterin reductase
MKYGIEFVPNISAKKLVNYSIEAENAGFKYIWITDHYSNRDVYVILTLLSMNTSKAILGTGVTNPYLRHPVQTATTILSLAEISSGRVAFGIGAGDAVTLKSIGVPRKLPLTAVRETIEIFKSILGGKQTYQGKLYNLNQARLNYKIKAKVPVYIGAQGEKMLQLAGKIGDGVLINASHPNDISFALKNIKIGVEQSNRSIDEIDVTAYTSFSIGKDYKKAIRAASPVVAFIVGGAPEKVLEKHDISLDKGADIKNKLLKGDIPGAIASVTQDMIDAFSITGTPEECLERIDKLKKLGVTQFVVGSPIGAKKSEAIKLIGEEIIGAKE